MCTTEGSIAAGRRLRGGSPQRLDRAAWRALFDRGVRVVVDLRDPDEAERAPTNAPEFMPTLFCLLEADLYRTPLLGDWFATGAIAADAARAGTG
ncbi:MAG: tyrosine-protein phosphatase [Myxococcales bacterium]|nr:tyrosine-protein phosphatase [Myxococcales bacterium]